MRSAGSGTAWLQTLNLRDPRCQFAEAVTLGAVSGAIAGSGAGFLIGATGGVLNNLGTSAIYGKSVDWTGATISGALGGFGNVVGSALFQGTSWNLTNPWAAGGDLGKKWLQNELLAGATTAAGSGAGGLVDEVIGGVRDEGH